jgi:uncharacterized protein YcfJ
MYRSLKPVHAMFAIGGMAALAAAPAAAEYGSWATVTQTRPIYSQINDPQQQCWTERAVGTDTYRLDQAPIGVHGTVVERPGDKDLVVVPREREVQRCRTVDNTRMQLDGYEVHYTYDGREYVTRLPYDPGSRVRVNVDVKPENRY